MTATLSLLGTRVRYMGASHLVIDCHPRTGRVMLAGEGWVDAAECRRRGKRA